VLLEAAVELLEVEDARVRQVGELRKEQKVDAAEALGAPPVPSMNSIVRFSNSSGPSEYAEE